MPAYLLLAVAILSRLLPHPPSFTAVGGALLYFGARRSRREMLLPLAAFMALDVVLTVFIYHSAFLWQAYVTTWVWYLAAMALGRILLRVRTTWLGAGSAVLLGPTSFFIVSNFGVWSGSLQYPHTASGLVACYVAAIPFYGNDLLATTLVCGLAFGVPVLVRRLRSQPAVQPTA
ncbi:MAG: DUF6580 family putative transport protein [Terracidiphilus sp.]